MKFLLNCFSSVQTFHKLHFYLECQNKWSDNINGHTAIVKVGSPVAATGRLEGVVELNRDDGELELTKLRYDLAGDYLCGVELTNGQSKNSSKEQVLIVGASLLANCRWSL